MRVHRIPSCWSACLACAAVLLSLADLRAEDTNPNRLLFQARAALADGLAPLAETLARQAYAHPATPDADRLAALELALAAIEAQGDASRLLAALQGRGFAGPDLPSDGRVALWRARALTRLGRPADAVVLLQTEAASASPEMADRFALHLPSTLLAAGDTNAALSAFARIVGLPVNTPEAAEARLQHARLLLSLNRTSEAVQDLALWLSDGGTPSPAANTARLLLAQLLLTGPEPQTAVAILRPLADAAETPADVRATALLGIAAAADLRSDAVTALSAREQAVAAAESPATKLAAQSELVRLLCRNGQADRAVPLLREAVQLNPRAPEVAALQLDVADALYRNGLLEPALAEVQSVIETHVDATLEARAQRARGETLAALGRAEEASIALLRAADLSLDAATQAACLFRAGETQRDAELHAQAADTLQRFQERFPESPLAARAALLQGESLSLISPADAERHLLATAERYAASTEGAHALFRAAQLADGRDDSLSAMARYEQVAKHPATPADLRAAALVGRGLLQFRAFHFDLALNDFERAAAEDNGPPGDQAAYLRAATLYNLGLENESLEAALAYLEARPDSPWAPDVTYWLGRFFFNRQEFAKAETYFRRFVETWPTRPECDGAMLWVARAHFALKRYSEASAAALQLIRESPRSALVPEARLIHGESLCELMRFDEAILVFDELLMLHPDSPWTAQALGRKGDALFTLGSDDQSRYKESVAAYEALLARPGLPLDSELQAAYKIGRCYEKSGQADQALDRYYRGGVLRFLEARDAGTWPNERARAWFSRAALSAADLYEQQEQWATAISVLQRMAREEVPGRAEAAERVKRLQQDHPSARP
jgi:tetratricopeptide (TPR) repeat protein